jgi:UDP-GlcNAc:undecaprenyl-phosphate GlcNAc-1-phosphate transferase
MNTLILPITFLVTLVAILLLRPLARKLGLMDAPGGRKTHTLHTPLIGGLGITLGLLVAVLLLPDQYARYHLLMMIALLLVLTGLVDDYYPLPAIVRLGIQILAAWLMVHYGGNQLVTLGRLFSDSELLLGRWVVVMTIFATVGVINALHMIDGMDGLSGGMLMICLAFMAITAGITGANPGLLAFTLLLMASVAAFLVLNFRFWQKKPALIYLGDSGSTTLGFILAWLLIESSQTTATGAQVFPATVALWFLAIPLMDTVYLFIARPLSGKSPFAPGTDHLHHMLAGLGWSRTKVVLVMYLAGLLLGLVGLAVFAVPALEMASLYVFLALFALYSAGIRLAGRKGTK